MSSPFGIALGSTPNSANAEYIVAFNRVVKPHPNFPSITGMWSPETGLYRITGRSSTYENDPYGLAVTADYDQIKEQLKKIYGPCFELETLRDGAIYDEARDFIESIARNDRIHVSQWENDAGSNLPDSIKEIYLTIDALSESDSQLILMYSSVSAPNSIDYEMAEVL